MDAASSHSEAPNASCPRCGYDQRGVISTWREACPLDGTCTECGYEFQWRELLSPILVLPPWCVEANARLRRWPRQFLATAVRCWIPNLLWRRLQAFHLIQRHRLAAWLATWLLVFVLITMLCNGVLAVAVHNQYQQARFAAPGGGIAVNAVDTSVFECVLQAMCLPLQRTSMGRLTLANGAVVGGLPSPRSLLEMQWRGPSLPLMFAMLIVPICCASTFAALPISRRRAKVRWVHIIRAAAYAGAIPFVSIGLLTLQNAFLRVEQSPPPAALASNFAALLDSSLRGIASLLPWLIAAFMLMFIPVTFVFWYCCVRDYLRMQHAMAVALSVTIIGLLAPIAMLGAMWVMLDFRLRF